MNKAGLVSKLKWIHTVSSRFARVDRQGRSAVTSFLATLGICFGVMTLITVMSVMNGFQMNFIDAIMEVSSYHIRAEHVPEESSEQFMKLCNNNKNVLSVTPFYEAQTLMTDETGRENAAVIRAIDPEVFINDKGFNKELICFDIHESFSINPNKRKKIDENIFIIQRQSEFAYKNLYLVKNENNNTILIFNNNK